MCVVTIDVVGSHLQKHTENSAHFIIDLNTKMS